MSTIVTRAGKGSPLTHTEVDNNFTNLNTDKYQSGDSASFSSITNTGDLSFSGNGLRIRGDFSNATLANRVAFQTNTTNGNTALSVIPNGTAAQVQYTLFTDANTTNGNFADLTLNNSEFRLRTNSLGTGTAVPMTFLTGGSERLRIDASGNVGIGTSSPAEKLTVVGGDIRIQQIIPELKFVSEGAVNRWFIGANISDTVNGGLIFGSGNDVASGTHRMVIDSSGNVGIGTSSPAFRLVAQDASSATRVHVINTANAAGGAGIYFQVFNGATEQSGVTIRADNADNLAFFNKGGERMRIDSSGNLLLGMTTTGGVGVSILPNLDTGGSINVRKGTAPSGSRFIIFDRDGTQIGSIAQSGTTAVAYNTSSDYRLKENIAPMTGALAKVSALKPCTYTWKADGSEGQGFIAHELAEVVPDAVTGEKDAVDAEGNPVYQGIDTSFLVATLTAAIQELKAELDTVKAELNTLKGN